MKADLILHSGAVHTVAGPHASSGATAVAIRGGRIIAVGSDSELSSLSGPGTETIDLHGRTLLPGFQDSHVHPPQGGLERMRCDLTGARTESAFLATIAAYAASTKDEWILGGGWSMEAFPGGCPTAAALDAIVADRPVFLPNRDHHSAWVNSRALEIAGVTRDTPDPADGRIERLPDGAPSGALHEGAMGLVERLLPTPSAAQQREALLVAQAYLHSLGITGWQDAWVTPEAFDSYVDIASSGDLSARVVGAMWWERSRGTEQIDELIERRARGPVGRFRPTAVKIMLDGVCETFTAAMLTPYLDGHGHETSNSGLSFVSREELPGIVTALSAAGFQVHMHALGDRGVRDALDAVGAAKFANGPADLRHQIAHLQVVHPDDVSRFGTLDVTANAQALWACAEPQMVELTIPYLGAERATWQYPFASIARAGGRIALGSDWPVSSPDPLEIMHVAVHRTEPSDPDASPFLPDERMSLREAVYAYTMGSAHTNHHDDVTGSIEVGKLADLVVLDRDIFAPDGGPLASVTVDLTLIEGVTVFEAPRS
jgi:predicted amidohydrolase YtcJ